ncbi:MAG: type II toxin-antitoxin system RelE/ParE family toxin [Pseudomonadota bacterium]
MMEVIWQPKATKQLKKIGDRTIQGRILTATRGLMDFPTCSNVKRLTHHACTHRLRVGDWRILFNVFEEISIASIEEVKKRDENTY